MRPRRALLLWSTIFLLTGLGSLTQARTIGVIVGIYTYDSPQISSLRAAVSDARAFSNALVQHAGARENDVKVLTSDQEVYSSRPTKANIVKLLKWAQRIIGVDDTLIFYFAGHGVNRWNKSYILPVDADTTDTDLAALTSLALEDLRNLLAGIHCAHQIIIMDCCRNDPEQGRGDETNAASSQLVRDVQVLGQTGHAQAGAKSSTVLFSCREGERAYERPDGRHGVFTHFLLEGLGGAAARAGEVTLADLCGYVERHVPAYISNEPGFRAGLKQTPWHKSEGSGRVLLARVSASTPTVVQPIATTAALQVRGTPAGAEVYVDGQKRGVLPCGVTFDLGALKEKQVEVIVQKDGYKSTGGTVTLRRGKTVPWNVKLVALAAPPSATQPHPVPSGKPWERPGSRVGEEITGPHGGKLVWVPAGRFRMGSTSEDIQYAVKELGVKAEVLDNEQPANNVEMDGFWIGKCEVTNEQYVSFLNAASAREIGKWLDMEDQNCHIEVSGGRYRAKSGWEQHPVVMVTWYGAQVYCEHYGLSLPTEAQWEYAARGPESRVYPWGDEWDKSKCCSQDNRGKDGRTFPVGSFPQGASWCGALDLAGNVWEWCADWYQEDYYKSALSRNPPGPSSGRERVLRGGSWCDFVVDFVCRGAVRYCFGPGFGGDCRGFRVSGNCR